MKVNKKIIGNLEKCYSLATLNVDDTDYFLVAAEKHAPCYLYDYKGNKVDTIWEEPGGVMTMVQVESSNGEFLATHKFYSPNDSKEAKIIHAKKHGNKWKINTVVNLPFVHRFDILKKEGKNYIIACTIKSDHEYKDDWTHPGKVYIGEVDDDFDNYNEDHQLKLEVLKDGLTKNHGYYKNGDDILISAQEGVYKLEWYESTWHLNKIIDISASDAAMIDIDDDGKKEIVVISPFHGNRFIILKEINGCYKTIYEYPKPLEFLHAIYVGKIADKNRVVVGNRKGDQLLLCFTYENGEYIVEEIDRAAGSANVIKITDDDKDYIIAANREINEIAMYECLGD